MDWSPDRVAEFNPRIRGGWAERRPLLYPVWVRRVLVPKTSRRAINPLQTLVLRSLHAGVRDLARVAEHVGLERELLRFVVAELRARDFVAATGAVSAAGLSALDGQVLSADELMLMRIFQDGINGSLWHRVAAEMSPADVVVGSSGRPMVETGAHRRAARLVPFETWDPVMPHPSEILEAELEHRRSERRLGLDRSRPPETALARIQQVGEAERWHVLVWMYVPETLLEPDRLWYVTDPFGRGASEVLRRALQGVARQRRTGPVARLIQEVTTEELKTMQIEWAAMNRALREKAEDRLAELWPDSVAPKCREELVDALVEVEAVRQGKRLKSAIPAVYLQLRRALEFGVSVLAITLTPEDGWNVLFADDEPLPKDASAAYMAAAGKACGFGMDLPGAILNAAPGSVRRAWESHRNGANLRPSLAALVLAASQSEKHTLKLLAEADRTWLSRVCHIADTAGTAVHSQLDVTLEELEVDVEQTVGLCRSLYEAQIAMEMSDG